LDRLERYSFTAIELVPNCKASSVRGAARLTLKMHVEVCIRHRLPCGELHLLSCRERSVRMQGRYNLAGDIYDACGSRLPGSNQISIKAIANSDACGSDMPSGRYFDVRRD